METTTRLDPVPVRAEVFAAGVRAPYLRAGAGRPVVVLDHRTGVTNRNGAGAEPTAAWPAIADRLAARLVGCCRLIVPDAPPPTEELGDWLAAFADGLGVAGIALLVTAPLASAARNVALREHDLVDRLAVLGGSRPAPAGREPAIERVEREGIPLLVLDLAPRELERAGGLEALLNFLAGTAEP